MFIGHIGIIAATGQELISYVFWTMPNSTGVTLSGVNVIYTPPSDNVQIDWGDGSNSQPINSGTNYNHTFN
jgi:hypothetical protein